MEVWIRPPAPVLREIPIRGEWGNIFECFLKESYCVHEQYSKIIASFRSFRSHSRGIQRSSSMQWRLLKSYTDYCKELCCMGRYIYIYEESPAAGAGRAGISADTGCKPLQLPTKTPLFAPYCRSGFTGGQHALCRLLPWDLYLKCINNLREVRCDTPDSSSRRNTTAHFFFCCWWIYSSSLNLQSQIDQKGKPVGEMWEWEFSFWGGATNS